MEIIVKKMDRCWMVTREGDEYSSFSIFPDGEDEGFSVPLGDFNSYYPSLEEAVADLSENWEERCSDRARSDWD